MTEKKLESEDSENQPEVSTAEPNLKSRIRDVVFPFLGLILVTASAACFCLSNVIVKWLKDVDPFTISFNRFLILFAFSVPPAMYSKFRHGSDIFPAGHRAALVVRSLLGSSNLVVTFYALKHLSLADTNLIAATAPIFTVIFARIFIKEPIYKLDVFNILLVIAGIVLIVKPPFMFGDYEMYNADSEFVVAVITLVLSAARLQANVHVILRYLKDISVNIVMFHLGWIGSVVAGVCAATLGCRCIPDTARQWTLIIATGFVSYLAQVLLTSSAKFDTATKISIYRKAFDIIFAFAVQILFFDEIPDWLTIVGAVLISGAIFSSGIKKLFEAKV